MQNLSGGRKIDGRVLGDLPRQCASVTHGSAWAEGHKVCPGPRRLGLVRAGERCLAAAAQAGGLGGLAAPDLTFWFCPVFCSAERLRGEPAIRRGVCLLSPETSIGRPKPPAAKTELKTRMSLIRQVSAHASGGERRGWARLVRAFRLARSRRQKNPFGAQEPTQPRAACSARPVAPRFLQPTVQRLLEPVLQPQGVLPNTVASPWDPPISLPRKCKTPQEKTGFGHTTGIAFSPTLVHTYSNTRYYGCCELARRSADAPCLSEKGPKASSETCATPGRKRISGTRNERRAAFADPIRAFQMQDADGWM